jgi:Mg2+-importing ATPase
MPALDPTAISVSEALDGVQSTLDGLSAAEARSRLLRSLVLRDGQALSVPSDETVSGDVVLLKAGDTIAGDGLLLESKDLCADESALTGEIFWAEKRARCVDKLASPAGTAGVVWAGTHVVSGTAGALLIATNRAARIGEVSKRVIRRPPETEFDRRLRQFGAMLVQITSCRNHRSPTSSSCNR